MIDTSSPGWQIDLLYEPGLEPFGAFAPRRHLIGRCAECGRAFERVVESRRQFLVGIWMPLSAEQIARLIAEHERDVTMALAAHGELVHSVGVCEHDGRHRGSEYDEDEWD